MSFLSYLDIASVCLRILCVYLGFLWFRFIRSYMRSLIVVCMMGWVFVVVVVLSQNYLISNFIVDWINSALINRLIMEDKLKSSRLKASRR